MSVASCTCKHGNIVKIWPLGSLVQNSFWTSQNGENPDYAEPLTEAAIVEDRGRSCQGSEELQRTLELGAKVQPNSCVIWTRSPTSLAVHLHNTSGSGCCNNFTFLEYDWKCIVKKLIVIWLKMFQVKFHEGGLDWAKPPSVLPGGTHTFPSPSCGLLPLNLWGIC